MDKATDAIEDESRRPGPRHAASRQSNGWISSALCSQLPPGCREVFVLHDVEGYEHKEIAAMLGIAEGTSKSQVFKARMKLRALLT